MTFTPLLLLPLPAAVTLPLEGVEGLLIRVGAAVVASTAIWKAGGKPIQRGILKNREQQEARLVRIEEQGKPNGSRLLLPKHMRDLPLADLVVLHITETTPLIAQFVEQQHHRSDVSPTEGP